MTNTEKLFELLYLLMAKRRMTAGEIADHFEVSVRTVYRWVDSLCMAGIPIGSSQGKGGGIYLAENYALDKTLLSEDEKLNILAAVNAFSTLSGASSEADPELSAAQKLRPLSAHGTEWLEIDFAPWNPLGAYLRTLFAVARGAILKQQQLSIEYYSSRGETGSRTLQPWKLVFRGQAWYLYGWCNQKKEPRYFKLSRIQDIKNLQRPMTVFSDSDCAKGQLSEDYVSHLARDFRLVNLVVKVPAEEAYRIMDDYKVDKQEPAGPGEEGMLLLTFQMPDEYWLVSYLLSFGSSLEVIAPEEVRLAVASEVKKMYAAVSKGTDF